MISGYHYFAQEAVNDLVQWLTKQKAETQLAFAEYLHDKLNEETIKNVFDSIDVEETIVKFLNK